MSLNLGIPFLKPKQAKPLTQQQIALQDTLRKQREKLITSQSDLIDYDREFLVADAELSPDGNPQTLYQQGLFLTRNNLQSEMTTAQADKRALDRLNNRVNFLTGHRASWAADQRSFLQPIVEEITQQGKPATQVMSQRVQSLEQRLENTDPRKKEYYKVQKQLDVLKPLLSEE